MADLTKQLYPNGFPMAVGIYVWNGSLWVKWDGSISGSIIAAVTNDGTFATPVRQDTGNTSLASILAALDVALSTRASQATLASVLTLLTAALDTTLSSRALESGGNLALSAASLSVLDDWDESDRAKVNPIAGQVGVQGASGVVTALTQRVVLATDVGLPAGTALIGKVGIDQTTPGTTNGVQVNAALPAGTNAIGKLAANSGIDIGDATLNNGAADETNGLFATANKVLASSTYAPSQFSDLGSNATANVKNATGNVLSLYCNNENAADRYIQLHNTATTPGAGATPLYTFRVPATGDILVGTDFFTNNGANFSTGIAFAFSTTKDTYTAATAGDQSTIIHYK